MLRRVIPSASSPNSAICPKILLFFASSRSFFSTMLQMVKPRVWALLSASCLKVSLFFTGSFKVEL